MNETTLDGPIRAILERIADLERASERLGTLGQPKFEGPSCRAYHNTTQTIPSGVLTAVSFNAETWLTESSMHSTVTNNSRVYAVVTGVYLIEGAFLYASAATSQAAYLRLNGVTLLTNGTSVEPRTSWRMTAGEYIELIAFHNSGGSRNIDFNAPSTPYLALSRF